MNNISIPSPVIPSPATVSAKNLSKGFKTSAKPASKANKANKANKAKKSTSAKPSSKASKVKTSKPSASPSLPEASPVVSAPIVTAEPVKVNFRPHIPALIISISIPSLPSYRKDKELSAKVQSETGASADSTRLIKSIGKGFDLKNNVTAKAGEILQFFYNNTSPFAGKQVGIIPAANAEKFLPPLRNLIAEYKTLVLALANGFEAMIEHDKVKLGDAFKLSDYPSREMIYSKAEIVLSISPFPDAHYLRGIVSDAIVSEAEKATANQLCNVNADLANRLHETVKHLLVALDGKKIHASAISALGEIADTVDSLNLGNDKLSALVGNVRTLGKGLNLEAIKDNEASKGEAKTLVNSTLSEIQAAMADFMAC